MNKCEHIKLHTYQNDPHYHPRPEEKRDYQMKSMVNPFTAEKKGKMLFKR